MSIPKTQLPRNNRSIALLGTMATDWRAYVISELAKRHINAISNADERWNSAKTAEEKKPLIERDQFIIRDASIVLWHYDAQGGKTAGVELGMLIKKDPDFFTLIVHVDADADQDFREYVRALASMRRHCVWAETLEEAIEFAQKFSTRL